MLLALVAETLSIKYEKRLLISDLHNFGKAVDYQRLLAESGFTLVSYEDVEIFRLRYEKDIKFSEENWAVIITKDIYVPYDIRKVFCEKELSLKVVFPKLNEIVLQRHIADIDIIAFAYKNLYSANLNEQETKQFIKETALNNNGIRLYALYQRERLQKRIDGAKEHPISYIEWMEIARLMALIGVNTARACVDIDWSFIDEAFTQFVMGDYSLLAGQTRQEAPAILTKTIDYVSGGKAAIIVMDGMSMFDFNVLSRYFDGIEYEHQCSYALVPTTTAISRQSLLSGKYPRSLENPFSLSKEENEFYTAAEEHGYTKQQAAYVRGYEAAESQSAKLLAIIINDIDEIVHGQQQGQRGMDNDITLLAQSGRLQTLICSLYQQGFTVYLTSDHGNTSCVGAGALRNTGVEVESKAKRAIILKNFANVSDNIVQSTLEFPGYYLDKAYHYRVCKSGVSFDNVGKNVMTHGGITLDEVIVPFIKIKAVM